jgi:hypothetical protein
MALAFLGSGGSLLIVIAERVASKLCYSVLSLASQNSHRPWRPSMFLAFPFFLNSQQSIYQRGIAWLDSKQSKA